MEDLYRPYRPKRRTRATIAKEKGLEPLADADILLQKAKESAGGDCEATTCLRKRECRLRRMLSREHWIFWRKRISDEADYRTYIRNADHGTRDNLVSEAKDEKAESVYEMYYHFEETL